MEERITVRCPRCKLVQYVTAAKRCRRCWFAGVIVPLGADPLVEARPAIPATVPSEAVDFSEALRYWRNIAGMNKVQLGTRMGRYRRTYIYRWERARRSPNVENIMSVAKALGIPARWLLVPWPTDGTSRMILWEASKLPAKRRWELMGKVRGMAEGRA